MSRLFNYFTVLKFPLDSYTMYTFLFLRFSGEGLIYVYRRQTAAHDLDLLPPTPRVPFNRSKLDAEDLSMH
jgi:hypothetical protein